MMDTVDTYLIQYRSAIGMARESLGNRGVWVTPDVAARGTLKSNFDGSEVLTEASTICRLCDVGIVLTVVGFSMLDASCLCWALRC
jgi:hypothetical protein